MDSLYLSAETATLRASLGSFLSDNDESGLYAAGLAAIADATGEFLRLQEATYAAANRHTVPELYRAGWRRLRLRKDASQGRVNAVYDSDAGYVYDGGLVYDQTDPARFAWPVPVGWADVPFLASRFVDPARTWLDGVDYVLLDGVLQFRNNPFDDPDATIDYESDGSPVLTLWTLPGIDRELPYRQFGYVFGARPKAGINGLFDAAATGTVEDDFRRTLAGLAGIPIVAAASDVRFTDGRLFVTDAEVLRSEDQAEWLDAATVRAGDLVSEALQVYDWRTAAALPAADLAALPLPADMLGEAYDQAIVFANADAATTVGEVNGKTTLEFTVGGFASDTARFWKEVHARGVADGLTLAEALDTRAVAVGEPTAADLPASINPMAFLLENVFRSRAVVVRFRNRVAGLASLRQILPPWFVVLAVVELSLPAETGTMDATDSVSLQPAMVVDETGPAGAGDLLTLVSGISCG